MKKQYTIFDFTILIISIIWEIINIYFYYDYNYTGKLFLIMIPNEPLIINIMVGFWGISLGVKILKKKIQKPIRITILILILYVFLWGLACFSTRFRIFTFRYYNAEDFNTSYYFFNQK